MAIASSTVGSWTMTGWKRRSRAASFSICRYSLSVVAPTTCSSPRASAGFKILPASIEPSAAPAPTSRWISSMNKMMFFRSCNSAMSRFIRSSNWPRMPVLATSEATSSKYTSLFNSFSGTCPSAIFSASPSTMAVFPTPGSPINTGLFLLRRFKISITRAISLSRPMTGSIKPAFAICVKLRPN